MSYVIIELLTLAAIVVAFKQALPQQQSNSVAIPVRTDENGRRR